MLSAHRWWCSNTPRRLRERVDRRVCLTGLPSLRRGRLGATSAPPANESHDVSPDENKDQEIEGEGDRLGSVAVTPPEDPVSTTKDLADRAKREVERVQERLRSAQVIERFCTALHSELSAGHPSESLRLIRGGSKAIAALRERSPESADAVEVIGRSMVPEVEGAFAGLLRSFPAAAQEAGLELDRSSRHPSYSLYEGFLTIDFEKRRLETRVQPRDGKRTTLGIDLLVVVAHLRGEVERLFNRPFDAASILGRIEEAYRAIVKDKRRQSGEAVPLKDLLGELGKDRSFHADEFNVDLSRLVRSEDSSGARLRLDHSRDSKNGMLLWQLEQRGYYGYIRLGEGSGAS